MISVTTDITIGYKLSKNEPFAYNTLINVFKYLNVEDLMRCSQVCKVWYWIAFDTNLWNSLLIRCCSRHIKEASEKYGKNIRNIELLNPKLLTVENLTESLLNMKHLRRIKLHGCHKDQLELLKLHTPSLEKIYSQVIWGSPPIELSFINNFKNLTHFELITYIRVTGFESFENLKNLKHLTFFAPCDESCWKYITNLQNLESLNLCANLDTSWDIGLFDSNFYLRDLQNLKKLQINDVPYLHEYDILEKIQSLSNIKELVLKNISISRAGTSNFGKLLARCCHVEKLTISILRVVFYNNILDVALENSEILKGVSELKDSLKSFTWIIDPSGFEKVKEFYNLENATVLKKSKQAVDETRLPWNAANNIAPVTLSKLLAILQKRLPNTNVFLLKEFPNEDNKAVKCFLCNEKAETSQDRMNSYN